MRLARVRRTPDSAVELVAVAGTLPEGGDQVVSLRGTPACASADPVAALVALGQVGLQAELTRLLDGRAETLAADDLIFEPPVATCSKICCLALNYRAHAEESGLDVPPTPVLFFKPSTALVGHRAPVRPPARTGHVEHEVELAVVIGREVRDLRSADWRSAVAGYTVINDMTARDLQLDNIQRNQPWDQSKGFDTFAPLGPYLVTPEEVPDPHDLHMALTVRDEVRQKAETAQMVFHIPQLLADLSDGMTLLPGDVIATGTTAGIAPVRDGDVMHATIAGVGTLINPIEWTR
jgi:5-oxopent-3-ene-1,2,5-tricarboxylate decarboxylase / 2-hydroxyhepta-2,4-diene-1,7-dioate isomerase